MASYLSTPDSPQEVQSPINLNLLNQALAANQGRYDDGLQKYENNLAQLKVQENLLIRDEDKQRFSQNVQGLIDEVNKNGKVNWAKSGLTNKINTYTNLAIDEYTMDQIGISQNIRKFGSEMDEKRKKNDGSYSDTNYAYAQEQAGLQEYLNGVDKNGNKVDKIGALQYSNYVDVNKTVIEKAKAFKELRGDETVEIPITDSDGVKRIQKTSVKGLTESQIIAYMPQILSPEENRQLQINGWQKYRGEAGLKVAQETFKSYASEAEKNLDENIKLYDSQYNNTNLSKEEREKAFKNKSAEEDRKKQMQQSFQSIDVNNPASIGGYLETASWKTNFAKMAGAKTEVTYDTDTAFYAAADLELKQEEALRKAELHPYELAKAKADASITAGGVGEVSGVSLSTIEPEQAEKAQAFASLSKDFTKQGQEVVAIANATLQGGGVNDDVKNAYDLAYADTIKKGYAPATAAKIAFSKSGMSNLFPEQYANILETYVRRGNTATVIKEANKETTKVFNADPEKYLKSAQEIANRYKQKQQAYAGSLEQDLSRTFSAFLPEQKDSDLTVKERAVSQFITNNGGIDNLQKKLGDPKNESLLNNFAALIQDVKETEKASTPFGIGFVSDTDSLFEDAIGKRNEVVAKRGQGIVNTALITTVSNPKLAEQIINAIPQEAGKVAFDPAKGITYKSMPDGTFVITQSGTKEGVSGIFGSDRTYTVQPTDDLYKILNNLTRNEAQRREVTADNHTTPINNENIQYLDITNKEVTSSAANFVASTLGNFQLSSKINPTYYLTEKTTNDVYKQKLRGVVAEEKIDALTNLMSTNSYDKFSVVATPVQGQWTTSISLKKGTAPLLLAKAPTGKKNADKQLLLLIKQYPQIMVGEAVLEYLQENPKEIDTVLNRLK